MVYRGKPRWGESGRGGRGSRRTRDNDMRMSGEQHMPSDDMLVGPFGQVGEDGMLGSEDS